MVTKRKKDAVQTLLTLVVLLAILGSGPATLLAQDGPATGGGAIYLPFAASHTGDGIVSAAASTTIVISQVYGGGGATTGSPAFKNDYIELFNRGVTNVSLAGWSVQYAATTGSSWSRTNLPTVSLAPGQYFIIQEAGGSLGGNLPTPDVSGTIAMAAGAGKVALVNNTTTLSGSCPTSGGIVDLVGYGTGTNCFEGSGPTATINNTIATLRLASGCTDTDNNAADFNNSNSPPTPRNTSSPLSPCSAADTAPTVSSTVPTSGATNVARATDVTITFSEPVNAPAATFTISCASSGVHTFSLSGGPTTFTLNVDVDFAANESCTVTVLAAQVTDQDNNDPPDNMTIDFTTGFTTIDAQVCGDPATRIHDVQGNGTTSPLNNSAVSIEGIVTGDYQGTGQFSGYYVQEEDAEVDADPATSEGIFVFNTTFPVNVGDKVRVRGTVFEFTSSGQTLTELTSVNNVFICSSGNSVTATTVNLPIANLADWERYEGMLIAIPQVLTATETFTLGRFGEVSLSVNGRLFNPTNIVTPGAPAIAQLDLNNRSRIVLDDGNNQQNIDPTRYPTGGLSASNTLRSGYTTSGVTGVLEQRFGVYRLQPVGPINFTATNPRLAEPAAVGGSLKIASFNVLNYFNGNGLGSGFPTARGASTLAEFNRQRAKTISALVIMNADIIGLMEMENDAVGNSAVEDLVNGLNAATAPNTYSFINTGIVGTDEIRVALIYKPGTVTPLGNFALLNSAVDPNFIDTKNRPTLAQTFAQNSNGARVTVAVNHLKSKGSDCLDVGDPDAGDGQGNCNVTRTKAAQALVNWLATDPTGAHDADRIIIGDMNAYALEDPITVIKNNGYTDLINVFLGAEAYSYVFDSQSGYLDHALSSASLVGQVTGVTEWHSNADEPIALDYNTEFKSANHINTLYASDPFRASDHDPVIIGLDLRNDPPVANAGGPYTADEGGSITLTASASDPDGTTVSFAWDLNNDNVFETPGQAVSFAAVDGPATSTVQVQVTDETGQTTVAATTLTINNVAPTVGTPTVAPEPATEGTPVVASATFSDPGVTDTPFTCTINYGDGSGDLAGVVTGNTCTGPAHAYTTAGSYGVIVQVTDKDGGPGSASTTHAVIFNWAGFFEPVDNLPTLNGVKAGSAIPIKFSLGGNKGLAIFAAGYPQSTAIDCAAGTTQDDLEQTVTAGGSSLAYDATTDQYTYVWKSDKAWANTCRQLIIQLSDGSRHYANFNFAK